MKSSSLHTFSADDKRLISKIITRFLYYPFNTANNCNPFKRLDSRIEFKNFFVDDLAKHYDKLYSTASPSRKLSDLFWLTLDWGKLKKEMKEIHICDIGCGSGNYSNLLKSYSNNNIDSYLGLDIVPNENWKDLENKSKGTKFKVFDGKNIKHLIPDKTNFFMSQSALEHIKADSFIFKQIYEFSRNKSGKVKQIHLFPSAPCLSLYGYHGVRQYTPRTVSKITKQFQNVKSIQLVSLGGKACIQTHKNYINVGLFNKDYRERKKEKYYKDCFEAIKKDTAVLDFNLKSAFYALEIDLNITN